MDIVIKSEGYMYIFFVLLLLFSACQTKLQKGNASENIPLKKEQKIDYSKLKVTPKEIKDNKKTLGGIVKKYTVAVENLPSNVSYQIHWYEQLKGEEKKSFIKKGNEYDKFLGGPNPGPNAVYGLKYIYAVVEYADGSKSSEVKVTDHRYLIKPGHDQSVEQNQIKE